MIKKSATGSVCRAFQLALLTALAFAFAPTKALAQWAWTSGSSSGSWPFGSGPWPAAPPEPRAVAPVRRATQPLAYSDPNAAQRFAPAAPGAPVQIPPPEPTTAYCVRLCDGRFFPLSRASANVTPAKLCSALCPASRTKVYEGTNIDEATAEDGARYERLSTAFLFRKELVASCTCNGKTPFGLAKIDISKDPTLQAGDIVATADGLKVFNGRTGRRHKAASFVPLKKSAFVSKAMRRELRSLKVAKERKAPERRL
jgi:hypothetical protein